MIELLRALFWIAEGWEVVEVGSRYLVAGSLVILFVVGVLLCLHEGEPKQ